MQGEKETLCSGCLKRNVCIYKDEFLRLTAETDSIAKAEIHSVELKCSERLMDYRVSPTNIIKSNY